MTDAHTLAVLERVRAGNLSPVAAAAELEAVEHAWVRAWAELPWDADRPDGVAPLHPQDRGRA